MGVRQGGAFQYVGAGNGGVGASHAAELPFHAELEALAAAEPRLTYLATISRPGDPANTAWTGETGRVDGLAERLMTAFDPATTHAYAVGHDGMIAAVRRSLRAAGFGLSTESYGS